MDGFPDSRELFPGLRGTTARSVSRHSTNTYSGSTPHQPYMGHIEEGSAGPRDRWGNRVVHPPQHHNRRAGAGQRVRPDGYKSRVDSHNRSLVEDQDKTFDWELEEQWEEEER